MQKFEIEKYKSVVQDQRNPDATTDRYKFIPTTEVVNILEDNGWRPTEIKEVKARKAKTKGYQKHLIRFSRQYSTQKWGVKESRPEIVLSNSHDGLNAFELMGGIYELVCSNGLIVARESYGYYYIPHRGFAPSLVMNALNGLLRDFPLILDSRERMLSTLLTKGEQTKFARRVIKSLYGDKYQMKATELLTVRHEAQKEPNLWNTLNVVQENALNGHTYKVNKETGRNRKSKAITSIGDNLRINQMIWSVAEAFAA